MTLSAWRRLLLDPLSEAVADGSGSGAAAGAGTGNASGGQSGSSAAAAGSGQGQNTSGSQSTADGNTRTGASNTGYTYAEDRSKWVPPHRISEETTKRTALETELNTVRKQLQALTGVTPADPDSEKAKAIDAAFRRQYPHLVPLLDLPKEQIEQLTRVPSEIGRVSEQEQREWNRVSRQQMGVLSSSVAEAIGADKLTADQDADLRDAFAAWFKRQCTKEAQDSRAATGEEHSPTLERYQDGDPELMKEFAKRYKANWLEPARRQATTQNLNRTRAVPNSSGRAQVTSVERPEKFASLDDRIAFAAKRARETGAVRFTD